MGSRIPGKESVRWDGRTPEDLAAGHLWRWHSSLWDGRDQFSEGAVGAMKDGPERGRCAERIGVILGPGF